MSFLNFGRKDLIKSSNLSYIQGIPDFTSESLIYIVLDDSAKTITINQRIYKANPCYLSCDQIIDIELASESDFKSENEADDKSVIGRAIVGGILFGGIGSIVGGLSGVGKKKLSTKKEYILINYHPQKNPNEIKTLIFKTLGSTKPYEKFFKTLKQKCNIKEVEENVNSGYL